MDMKSLEETKKTNLGLASRTREKYADKTVEDVIRDLDAISPQEAYEVISEYAKNHFSPEFVTLNKNYKYVSVRIVSSGSWYGGPLFSVNVNIEITEDSACTSPFIVFSLDFQRYDGQSHSNYVHTYIDWVLPGADIVPTYSWHIIYQNYSSFPYEITRFNVSKVLLALEKMKELGEEYKKEVLRVFPISNDWKATDFGIEKIASNVFKEFKTDELFDYASEHGALVSADESYEPELVKAIEILREASQREEPDIAKKLEESIQEVTGLRLGVKVKLDEGNNKVTISDESGKVSVTKKINLMNETIEEAIAKEASRLVGIKPNGLRYTKRINQLRS